PGCPRARRLMTRRAHEPERTDSHHQRRRPGTGPSRSVPCAPAAPRCRAHGHPHARHGRHRGDTGDRGRSRSRRGESPRTDHLRRGRGRLFGDPSRGRRLPAQGRLPVDLRTAIRTVAAGDALLAPSITAAVMRAVADGRTADLDAGALEGLSEREVEVLTCIGRGLTNAEIAAELFLSPATARTYVSRLLTRLDARDRSA